MKAGFRKNCGYQAIPFSPEPMEIPTFIAGTLQRDYLLPPGGRPLLDVPGGSLLYAAAGAAVWQQPAGERIGLLARVGEDTPREWLDLFIQRGFDVQGIRILPGQLDLRSFLAYTETGVPQRANPVAHFARLGIPYPKSLLGYQPAVTQTEPNAPLAQAPHPGDLPDAYRTAFAAHICPLDPLSHNRLTSAFQQAGIKSITLDPAAAWMAPAMMDKVRIIVHGLTAFLPSEEELRSLFWGQTDDLWAMTEAVASFGCELVVVKRGARGQMLFDARSRKRWEIPAYPARSVDPTCVGDSFCGGFLAGYTGAYDPLRAVLCGNVSASLTIEGSGAFHALDCLPGLAEARLRSLTGLVRTI